MTPSVFPLFADLCLVQPRPPRRQPSLAISGPACGADSFPTPSPSAAPVRSPQHTPVSVHLAFLDPYNLGTLSFELFVELAKLKRIDDPSDSDRIADID